MYKKYSSFLTGIILTLVLAGAGCNSSKPAKPIDDSLSKPPAEVVETQQSQPEVVVKIQSQVKKEEEKKAPEKATPAIYESKVMEFNIIAKDWKFDPGTIIVNQGDKVILKITSTDVTHSFMLKDYNINVKLEPNQTQVIEFIADKFGVFPFRCGVPCGDGHSDMTGTLVVK